MAKHFTDAEASKWLDEQPAKPVSSKVVLQDPNGRILILKPSYKPGWGLPDGMLDKGESPLRAAVRETEEETGILLTVERLCFMGIRYGVSRRSPDKDFLHVLFCASVTKEEIDTIHINTDESEDFKWVDHEELAIYLEENVGPMAARILSGNGAAV